MTAVSVLLIILSSFMHAGWNVLGKSDNPGSSFFLIANFAGTMLFVPIILFHMERIALFPPVVWKLLIFTGMFQAIYYYFLGAAYRSGEMSLAYPISRSLPVILVTLILAAAGGGEEFTHYYVVGSCLIVAGLSLSAAGNYGQISPKNILTFSNLSAALAAVGISGYSIIDKHALDIVVQSVRSFPSPFSASLAYMGLEGIVICTWLGIMSLVNKNEHRRFREIARYSKKKVLATGAVIYITYTLVLIAMVFAVNAGYIVAFRQLSVPIGTVFGCIFLGESISKAKFTGTGITLAGLILVAVG